MPLTIAKGDFFSPNYSPEITRICCIKACSKPLSPFMREVAENYGTTISEQELTLGEVRLLKQTKVRISLIAIHAGTKACLDTAPIIVSEALDQLYKLNNISQILTIFPGNHSVCPGTYVNDMIEVFTCAKQEVRLVYEDKKLLNLSVKEHPLFSKL
jgi:hypothetical protein